jgi:hypothetical protein
VFEWLLPQPVDDCLRVLSSCLLGGKEVTPLMCSTTETIGSNSGDGEEDTVRMSPCNYHNATACLGLPSALLSEWAEHDSMPVVYRIWWRQCLA